MEKTITDHQAFIQQHNANLMWPYYQQRLMTALNETAKLQHERAKNLQVLQHVSRTERQQVLAILEEKIRTNPNLQYTTWQDKQSMATNLLLIKMRKQQQQQPTTKLY
jgi:hypothetical protein